MMRRRDRAESDEFLLREVIHRSIDALVIGGAPAAPAMTALLVASAATCPSTLWPKLRRVHWNRAIPAALASLERALHREPPPRSARALFFTQPELELGERAISWTAYADFVPEDPKHAFVGRELRWPHGAAELSPSVFTQVRRIAAWYIRDAERRGSEPGNELSIPLFACSLGMTCFLACAMAQTGKSALLLRGRRSLGIVAGPAGGEVHALGLITKSGWLPAPRSWRASRDPSFERDVTG